MARRGTVSRSVRQLRGGIIGLGIVGTLFAEGKCAAQVEPAESLGPASLTVRPREMATGTKNVLAGSQPLDTLEDFQVYVPARCVGTQRCPLVVFVMHGYGPALPRKLAEKYGTILLEAYPEVSSTIGPFYCSLSRLGIGTSYCSGSTKPTQPLESVARLDIGLKHVLRLYAIDPDKIALTGSSDGGSFTAYVGRSNPEVFSRIAPISPGLGQGLEDPPNTTAQFFLAAGIREPSNFQTSIQIAQEVRKAGHAVTQVLGLRDHSPLWEDWDYTWRWFHESWATPSTIAHSDPSVSADRGPLLTPEILTQMTTFWTKFMQEPDSIRETARQAHQKEITILVGRERLLLTMMDIPTLAAKYPWVAAALKAAGLTAQQAEDYRIALVSAKANLMADWHQDTPGRVAGPVEATSVLGKNIAFLNAQSDELNDLGMWITP